MDVTLTDLDYCFIIATIGVTFWLLFMLYGLTALALRAWERSEWRD